MSDITVLIPAYVPAQNPEIGDFNNLEKTLYSLRSQNFDNFNIIVASNIKIHPEKKFDIKISYKVFENALNIADLINQSSNLINTKYTCFLNCGDLLLFDAVKLRYKKLLANDSLIAVYGLGFETDRNYEIFQNDMYDFYYNSKKMPTNSIESILNFEFIPSLSSLMIKTDILSQIQFNSDYTFTHSIDYFVRLFSKHEFQINRIADPIYLTAENENNKIKANHNFFKCFLTESYDILSQNVEINKNCYQNLFWLNYFLLKNFFPNTPELNLYLMCFYLKKSVGSGFSYFNHTYFLTLLNNITGFKQCIYDI